MCAVQVKKPAPGCSDPNAGPVVTPPPTRPAFIGVINSARIGGDGPGQNSGANNPSVIPAGTQLPSKLAANLKASVTDPALDAVIAGKSPGGTGPTGQERMIDKTPIRPSWNMRNRSSE